MYGYGRIAVKEDRRESRLAFGRRRGERRKKSRGNDIETYTEKRGRVGGGGCNEESTTISCACPM